LLAWARGVLTGSKENLKECSRFFKTNFTKSCLLRYFILFLALYKETDSPKNLALKNIYPFFGTIGSSLCGILCTGCGFSFSQV